MKKILLCVLGFMILVSSSAFAVDVTVGVSTWYAWWKFRSSDEDSSVKTDPGFLYGPALAIKFNDDFNLTGVFLYGKFNGKESDEYNLDYMRMDSDVALNYRLNDYLKIFAGIKYMRYTSSEVELEHSGLGPGIGISAAYPIADSLFLLATLSGFYLWGNEEYIDDYFSKTKVDYGYKEYGINTTLALAYYIPSISTVISLGGRYQQIKGVYDDVDDTKETSKFYGITLTVTYTF